MTQAYAMTNDGSYMVTPGFSRYVTSLFLVRDGFLSFRCFVDPSFVFLFNFSLSITRSFLLSFPVVFCCTIPLESAKEER